MSGKTILLETTLKLIKIKLFKGDLYAIISIVTEYTQLAKLLSILILGRFAKV